MHEGLFEDELDKIGSTVQTQTFDSGSDTIEQLLGGSLDATYIGPSPTLTAYAQSHGDAVRVVSGVTSGGASLVVQPEIKSVDDLAGTTLATPGLANTQDIAARAWLKEQGYETDTEGGGDLSVLPQDNSITIQQFQQGKIDAAWVPEPYASILVARAARSSSTRLSSGRTASSSPPRSWCVPTSSASTPTRSRRCSPRTTRPSP